MKRNEVAADPVSDDQREIYHSRSRRRGRKRSRWIAGAALGLLLAVMFALLYSVQQSSLPGIHT